ncbi:MAG: DoxX family protein [Saprospiraceae bacterium]|nr:DoxX family protein [Saprospiraceae bacterium]
MEVTILDNLGISADLLLRSLSSLFVAILFIQSGVDKVVNWKGEKEFYTSHFKKSILKGTVPLLMPVITISELAAGFLSSIGLIIYVAGGSPNLAFLGMLLANLSIIQLFFGQRVAKDFAGAASLVPYFLITVVGLYFYLS